MDHSDALNITDRWWDEVWRDGELEVIDQIMTDPFVRHSATGSQVTSRQEYKKVLAEIQRTLYKPRITIDDRAVSGDRVWTRATTRGVNRETGEPTVVTWMLVQRISGDRIAEHWVMSIRGVDWTT